MEKIKNLESPTLYVDSLYVKAGDNTILSDINFELFSGDILGLIGETRSGKTVLIDSLGMNSAAGLISSARDLRYRIDNEDIHLMEKSEYELNKIFWGKNISFILSNARSRFNPIMTVGEQFRDVLKSNLGLSNEKAKDKAKQMFSLVQMPDPNQNYNNYPHELSGGMIQRVEIAIALSLSPKYLLADEPTMGLDVTVQRQILDMMRELIRKTGSTVVLATRDLGIAANYCNKIAVLYKGEIIEFSNVKQFFRNPRHPYSKYLLEIAFASNQKDPDHINRVAQSEMESNDGCFCSKTCDDAEINCELSKPGIKHFDDGSYVRCHCY